MTRPGVMIYFEVRKALELLNDAQKGQLFQGILDYAELGAVPQFTDILAMAWAFVQPQIDRDGERYADKAVKSKYAVYVRETKKKDEQPISFGEWSNHLISDDIGRYPTTTTATTTAIKSKADKPPAPPKKARKSYGEFGWVKLTDEEYHRLLNDLGEAEVKRCIAYVDESAQSTGNKNKWRDWNLVVKKCHKQGWGLEQRQQQKGIIHPASPMPDYGGEANWSL